MLPSINGPLMTLRHDHFMTKCGSALGGSGSALHMDLLCSGSAPHGSPLHMSLLCSTWVWRESLGRVGPLVITAGSRAASRPASSAVRTTTQSGQPLSCTSTGRYMCQAQPTLLSLPNPCQVQVLKYMYQVQPTCMVDKA